MLQLKDHRRKIKRFYPFCDSGFVLSSLFFSTAPLPELPSRTHRTHRMDIRVVASFVSPLLFCRLRSFMSFFFFRPYIFLSLCVGVYVRMSVYACVCVAGVGSPSGVEWVARRSCRARCR